MKKPRRINAGQPRNTTMKGRVRSSDEYHSHRWTKLSRAFRQRNPLCVRCKSNGIIRASEVTDHIIPPDVHGNFWDQRNWQALCRSCNLAKGAEDKKLIQQHRNENR